MQTLDGHTGAVTSVALSQDGRRAISGSSDETLRVWDLENGKCLAQVAVSEMITSLGLTPGGILAVVSSGKMFNLHTCRELLCPGWGIATAKQMWDFSHKELLQLSADCPFCRHRFAPDNAVVDTIKRITEESDLTPEQSPCLDLPEEAWDDPGLLSNCPNCGEALRFNPFFPAHL